MQQTEDPFIYHLVLESEFHLRTADDFYTPARFEKDGFIHCTATEEMTLKVAKDYFSGQKNVLLLRIRLARVKAPVRFEGAALTGGISHLTNAALFPHIYGPLNLSAVEGTAILKEIDESLRFPQFS